MTRNASVGEGSVLSKELRLSNGVTLSNRIAQSAMTEHLATGDGAPSWQLIEAYRRFAVSGAALIISGNVMVNEWSLEAPRNVVIEDERHLPQLRQWAATTAGSDARLILQLSLAGGRVSVAWRWPGAVRMSRPPRRYRRASAVRCSSRLGR
jgi:2,4-dienoyl-CoA reductase-like NADH-dependent reductase (Old Yellow Enzyme family)